MMAHNISKETLYHYIDSNEVVYQFLDEMIEVSNNKEKKININSLETQITRLKEIKAECDAIDTTGHEFNMSKGKVANQASETDLQFKAIQEALSHLIDNSIAFFENTKNSFVESDKKASSDFK